jgi:hypothetical protein
MPFIKQERRKGALTGEYADPGDLCYKHYRAFIDMWKKEPRWTTIDNYAKRIWNDDDQRAAALALLVFMYKHGFKYEAIKEKENGGIE